MNLIVIDSATKVARVCLKTESICIYNEINNEITHSEKLLPLIDKTLKEAKLSIDEINALGITTGPGSFTGIRIGIATAKGLAFKNNLNIYPLSNLELMVNSCNLKNDPKYIISMIDAKHDRVYFEIYENKSKHYISISSPQNLNIIEALKYITNTINQISVNDEIVFLLDNKEYFENVIKENFKTNIKLLSSDISLKAFANLIFEGKIKNTLCDMLDATYARLSEAERTKCGE